MSVGLSGFRTLCKRDEIHHPRLHTARYVKAWFRVRGGMLAFTWRNELSIRTNGRFHQSELAFTQTAAGSTNQKLPERGLQKLSVDYQRRRLRLSRPWRPSDRRLRALMCGLETRRRSRRSLSLKVLQQPYEHQHDTGRLRAWQPDEERQL